MNRLRLLAAALLATVGSGCGTGAEPPDMGHSAAMTLGTADASGQFAPLVDGQDVTLVEGAQGGFHVWMKFRVAGMAPQTVHLARTAHRLSDDAPVLRTMTTIDVGAAATDGAWEVPMALPMFMCPSPIGIRVVDEPIVYDLAMSDDAGHTLAEGSITLVPRCPADQEAFCMKICTG